MDKDKKNQIKNQKTEDQALWEFVTKDVTPIHNHTPNTSTSQKKHHIRHSDREILSENKNANLKNAPQTNETDAKTARKLKRGQIKIENRLDLHGMSQSLAYASLKKFIQDAYAQNCKCILVITGKGAPKHGNIPLAEQTYGVLKTQVPRWLNEAEFKQYILKFEWAKPKDGGEGALYVLMRRNK